MELGIFGRQLQRLSIRFQPSLDLTGPDPQRPSVFQWREVGRLQVERPLEAGIGLFDIAEHAQRIAEIVPGDWELRCDRQGGPVGGSRLQKTSLIE